MSRHNRIIHDAALLAVARHRQHAAKSEKPVTCWRVWLYVVRCWLSAGITIFGATWLVLSAADGEALGGLLGCVIAVLLATWIGPKSD